jgi:glutaredoxin 3
MAKRLLVKSDIAYHDIDLAMDEAGRRALFERTGRMTFPQVLIDDEPIGGYLELVELARRGELPSTNDDARRAA